MTDRFYPSDAKHLIQIILHQLSENNEFFGIPKTLIYSAPHHENDLNKDFWGQNLATPLGLAAGPHTQMAQNIVAGWLCGARFIELKTIQILDELEVTKPCIDMHDLGFNCEWSQELKIQQSLLQYQSAWVIIHLLFQYLNQSNGSQSADFQHTIFNASVGYNLQGIKSEPVDRFLNELRDSSKAIKAIKDEICTIFPKFSNVEISPKMVDTLTLSTMHGCPPEEIETIGKYLLEEKKFNLLIKLNPTLLGKERVREILNYKLGFDVIVPDIAFDHDPKFNDAVKIIKSLQKTASQSGLKFGIKLSNTLETLNLQHILPENEKMVYMSGRGLLPVTVNLALELQKEFQANLDISYSGGADFQNIDRLLGCGFFPVTVCTDLLKPGGYGRLAQYFETIENSFKAIGAKTISDFILNQQKDETNIKISRMRNLEQYASEVLISENFRKTYIHQPNIKGKRALELFDCNHAPCTDRCATHQNIPEYIHLASKGNFNKSLEVIRATNPLPSITGTICDHLCQYSCIRSHYDEPVKIREIKRSVVHHVKNLKEQTKPFAGNSKTAIIGAGPGGLSCAHFLSVSGMHVDVFDIRPEKGGMVSYSLPQYRIGREDIDLDLNQLSQNIKFHLNSPITQNQFSSLLDEYDFVVLASGAWKPRAIDIPGSGLSGIMNPVDLLHEVNIGSHPQLGNKVVVIGGGNTAMDAARTAKRLVGNPGEVTIVYRRSIKEMPADEGEIKAVIAEGIKLVEMAVPSEFIGNEGKVTKVHCLKTSLIHNSESQRAEFEIIPDSDFELECDTVIPAIGHIRSTEIINSLGYEVDPGKITTNHKKLFVIGDAARGASTAINAIADGKNAAFSILEYLKRLPWTTLHPTVMRDISISELRLSKFKRVFSNQTINQPFSDCAPPALSEDECVKESLRCIQCDLLCANCATVCPNLANVSVSIFPVNQVFQSIIKINDSFEIADSGVFKTSQQFQILNIGDWCNECGNCNTFCPTKDAPFRNKPRIHLSKASFENDDRGFYFENTLHPLILYKSEHQLFSLLITDRELIFAASGFRIQMDSTTYGIRSFEINNQSIKEISTMNAVYMKIIYDTVIQSRLIN